MELVINLENKIRTPIKLIWEERHKQINILLTKIIKGTTSLTTITQAKRMIILEFQVKEGSD
eukprot:5024541-Heterocapsa_arctica.AAC.1